MAALFETSDVPGMLQIDCLATEAFSRRELHNFGILQQVTTKFVAPNGGTTDGPLISSLCFLTAS
jgi:hypothetical protein